MKKFFQNLSDLEIGTLLVRYPLFALSSISITIYALLWVLLDWTPTEEHLKLCSILLPGIILGLSEGIWRHRIVNSRYKYMPMVVAIIGLLGFTFNATFGYEEGWSVFRYVIYLFIAHLVFSSSLWLASDKNMPYWSINIQFLLRFLGGVILAALLAGALILIIHLIYFLFLSQSHIHEDFYPVIFILSAFFYHPFFFGSKLLDFENVKIFEGDHLFRTAVSYILTPMLWIYLIIIYSYFIKTLVLGDWPVGGVSYWISALSVSGVLLYLLGYKYFKHPKYILEKLFYRYYFIVLIPAIGLLFLAIFKRIGAYGWTENRFFIVISGIWLLGISLYFIFSKKKKLSVIPATFAAVLFIATVGPFSAYRIGISSQKTELKQLMVSTKTLVDTGFVYVTQNQLEQKDKARINSILRYLSNRNALDQFVHMNDPQKFTKLKNNHHASYSFLRKVINPNNSFEINDINDNYNQVNRIINFKEPKFIEVSTYDRYYEIRGLRSQDFYINKESGGSYEIGFNIQPYEGAKFSIPIEVISDLLDTESVYTHNRESLYLISKDSAKYKLCLKHLNVKKNTVDQSLHGVGIEAILLSRENGID